MHTICAVISACCPAAHAAHGVLPSWSRSAKPAAQSTHAFETTFLLARQNVGSHTVLPPAALSPATFRVPAGQFTQVLDNTFWSAKHIVGSHMVLPPAALSPASFVVPDGQFTQALDTTFWSAKHRLAGCLTMIAFPPLRTRAVASLVRLTHYRPSRSATVLTWLAVFAHAAWNGLANRSIVPLPQSTRGDTGRLVP